jgi:cytoskeletal protein RodZ
MAEDPRHRTNTAGPAEPALDPAGPRRDTVGRILRRGRERDGLRLRDVADALRIRYDYLDAIERSEFDALPGATYAIGFVRSYASYLALDDEAIVRQFKQEVRGLNRTQDLSFPEPVNEGKVPGKALLLVSLVFVGAAYGGWHYLSQSPDRQISDMVPAVPDRLKAFLDDGGSTSPSEDAGSASVTDFAEGGDGAAAGADDGSSPSADGTAAGTAPDAAEGGDTAAEPRAAPDSPEGSTAGADTAQTAGAQEAAPATQADAPQVPPEAAPETPDATSGTARRDSAGATETATTAGTSTGEPAATGDAGAGASTTPDQTSEPGAPTTTDTGDPATAVPEAPSSAPGNADATQTASVPDAPDPDGGAAGTAGAGEAAATGTPSGDGATAGAGTDPAAATNDGADDAAADGIPEPPSPTGGSADGTAAADGIGGPQSAALPDTAGGDAEPAAGVNGAQAQVLAQAERVFGPANGRSRMLLRATQDSWVQVRGADDSPLLTRVLNPGDVYRVPDQDGLILHTGNAGGLKVYIDGNPAGSLGQTGEVKRNVTLSPDAMR